MKEILKKNDALKENGSEKLKKRLRLNKETLRELDRSELKAVAGGTNTAMITVLIQTTVTLSTNCTTVY
jgi:hypothetical protein